MIPGQAGQKWLHGEGGLVGELQEAGACTYSMVACSQCGHGQPTSFCRLVARADTFASSMLVIEAPRSRPGVVSSRSQSIHDDRSSRRSLTRLFLSKQGLGWHSALVFTPDVCLPSLLASEWTLVGRVRWVRWSDTLSFCISCSWTLGVSSNCRKGAVRSDKGIIQMCICMDTTSIKQPSNHLIRSHEALTSGTRDFVCFL